MKENCCLIKWSDQEDHLLKDLKLLKILNPHRKCANQVLKSTLFLFSAINVSCSFWSKYVQLLLVCDIHFSEKKVFWTPDAEKKTKKKNLYKFSIRKKHTISLPCASFSVANYSHTGVLKPFFLTFLNGTPCKFSQN